MKIVFPMAGRGSRFQAASDKYPDYRKPKPLISIFGRPMIIWAVKSLPFVDLPQRPAQTSFTVSPKDIIFICLEEHEEKFKITSILKKYFSDDVQVILIPEVTRGASETALAAKEYIDPDEPLIISDSDHYFEGESYYRAIVKKDSETIGIIPIFKPPDDEAKWSYTLFDNSGLAIAVGEKDQTLAKKGAFANIGAYYFAKGDLFLLEAEKMIKENALYGEIGKKEFYIAPIYQRLIEQGMKIKVAVIDKVWGLGTPKDLEKFLREYKE
jgi:NDP-sugar pyrophosphorylase family protein